MGGGLSLTFPGYHIFASGIIMMTGMSDYLAQTFIVALFSSLIVLAAYLVTRGGMDGIRCFNCCVFSCGFTL